MVELSPNAHGDSVPVLITVDYQDSVGQGRTHTQKFFLIVAPAPETSTTISINAGRDVNIGGDVAGRDKNVRTDG
jgi:hypothetical protein